MLQQLTFVDSVMLMTVVDSPAVRGKFSCSCKNTRKFIARLDDGVHYNVSIYVLVRILNDNGSPKRRSIYKQTDSTKFSIINNTCTKYI